MPDSRMEASKRGDIGGKVMKRSGTFWRVSLSTMLGRCWDHSEIPPPVAITWMVACSFFMLIASCNAAAATAATTETQTLNSSGPADGLPDHYCPPTCFCDLDSSLVSCAGAEDEAGDVIWVDTANRSVGSGDTTSNIPDDIWSVVAATGIQRLDVRDLILQRGLDKALVNGTERLNELSLVRCRIFYIGNRTFVDHSNLERLDLSQNQLAILSQVIFIATISKYKLNNNNNIDQTLL